ncbi:hypothetical protein F5X68DRAFT_270231 [Plectosphaerella plurivora]|uniref:Zn(2)-C6 fungal-type domain-containing protein n=1 Tax=Plectosphaerella plurivora TaxID=936078 RepID=A0A9P8V6T2_9PEZI|nr:hypothetical protein F5X68DRAFT_270231 [Plectosphaerella plurivora]
MADFQDTAGHTERPTPAAARARRGSEICFQCRNRKVRCDGTPGGCENCKRLHFECSLSEVASSAEGRRSLTQLERRRVRRACIACRDRKSKCTGSYPSCVRCLRLGIDCQYPSASRGGGVVSASSNMAPRASGSGSGSVASRDARMPQAGDALSPSTQRGSVAVGSTPSSAASPALSFTSEPNIDKSVIKQHIDAFFDFVHPIPCHGFLHRATLLQSWSKGTLNPRLLRAICGVTARFVFRGDIDRQHQARLWIHETEAQLLARVGEPRMSDVEAWMLVTLDHILSRRFGKMLVTMCLLARLAYILRLNHEEDRLPFLIQERRRRLMWSIYVVDTFYSSGRTEFTAVSTETIHLRLPCNEQSFAMDVPVVTEPLIPPTDQPPSRDMGLMAYIIRVLDIRDRTQRLSLTITNHRKPLPECLVAVESIERELRELRASLPPTYLFDHKNFFLRAYTPTRTPFLMLHAWWHQTHCDLYRFVIPGFREGLPAAEIAQLPTPFVAACRANCLSHALSVSRVLDMAKQAGVDIIADPCLAMCAFHSARIISRLGQPPLGDVPKLELVRRLAACAAALEEQAGMYPTTGILRGGIMDLIHDAQRTPRGSSPMRSIWEAEEAEADEPDGSTPSARAASEGHEVYSKYSVTEEIRKLKFQEEDGEEDEAQEGAEGEGQVLVHQSIEVQGQGMADMHQQQMSPFGMDRQGMDGQMPMPQQSQHLAVPLNPFGQPPDPGLAYGSAGYDVAMTVGFDPRYQSGQPDMFMDSFWPVTPGTDWTMMNMENQM